MYCSKECQAKARGPIALNRDRKCIRCERTLAPERFAIRTDENARRSSCKDCDRVYYRAAYAVGIYQSGQRHAPRKPRPPEKQKAKNIFDSAVRRGLIKRRPCEVCGGWAEGHHEDYGKPLDVRWLCRKHHMVEHRLPVDTPYTEASAISALHDAGSKEGEA